jgi:signal transduction histidine kinase
MVSDVLKFAALKNGKFGGVVHSQDPTREIKQPPAVLQNSTTAAGGSNSVLFYENDSAFLEDLSEFVGDALGAGGSCVVTATKTHLQEVLDRLRSRGIDADSATSNGRYFAMDAEETRDTSDNRWVNVAELIQDVMLVYERKLRCKSIQTLITCDRTLKLFGKQGELKQALSNLLANAVDASTKGGNIWLRAKVAEGRSNGMRMGVRIILADNGSGMSSEVKRRIFVPFFTTKPSVGTGIGLWVTKCLIEQHGSRLRFRSRQGQKAGTVMSFFVPGGKEEPSVEAGTHE